MWLITHQQQYFDSLDMGSMAPEESVSITEIELRYVGQESALLLGFVLSQKARESYAGNGSPKGDIDEILRWGDELNSADGDPGLYLYQYDESDALVGTVFSSSSGGTRRDPLPFLGDGERMIIQPNDTIYLELHMLAPSAAEREIEESFKMDFLLDAVLSPLGLKVYAPTEDSASATTALLINEYELTDGMASYVELVNKSGADLSAAEVQNLRLNVYDYDGNISGAFDIGGSFTSGWAQDAYFVLCNAAIVSSLPPGTDYHTLSDYAIDGAMSSGIGLIDSVTSEIFDAVAWSVPYIGDPVGEGATAPQDWDPTSLGRDSSSTDTDDNAADFTTITNSPGSQN